MLVLSRKSGEQIVIGSDIVITTLTCKGNRVLIGIDAPESVRIERSESPKSGSVDSADATQNRPMLAAK